jgi:hypothetical protein
MPRYICHHEGLFFEWSTVVDALVSAAMTENEFRDYYRQVYGSLAYENDFELRIARAKVNGTSCYTRTSIGEMIKSNRAGDNESQLSLNDILFKARTSFRSFQGLPPLYQINKENHNVT